MEKLCIPNALATFKEYAIDFASNETKIAAEKFIKNEIENLDGATKRKTEEMIKKSTVERGMYSFNKLSELL